MNTSGKHFIIGRRYFINSGDDTYFALKDRYTASGYRYIRFRSDRYGHEYEYKVHIKDGLEYVDILGGAIKDAQLDDTHLILSKNETLYITMSEKESRFMHGEEVYVSHDELLRWLQKLPLTSHMGFKIQRDPHEISEPVVKRDI